MNKSEMNHVALAERINEIKVKIAATEGELIRANDMDDQESAFYWSEHYKRLNTELQVLNRKRREMETDGLTYRPFQNLKDMMG